MKQNILLTIISLSVIAFIAFIWDLGNIGLVDETEPLFAEAAKEMLFSGDWITPYFNGETRFDKPILIYWFMALCYHVFGNNEWAVRLPSSLSAIAIMFFLFFTLKYFGFNPVNNSLPLQNTSNLVGIVGSYLFAFNLLILVWGRTGVSDMLLTACITSALLCFFWGYVQSEKQIQQYTLFTFPNRWYFAFYIFLALGVLTKGPVALVIPILIIISFLLCIGQLKQVVKEIGCFWGTLVFLALCLPWYILVIIQNGNNFINSFFGYHNFERFTSVVNRHSAPWYFYFIVVLVGFGSYSVYLPLAIGRIKFWQRRKWGLQPRYGQLSLFAFFWFSVIFIFFTIAVTKLPSYVIPLIPAAVILITCLWAENLSSQKKQGSLFISACFNLLFTLVLAVASIYFAQLLGPDSAVLNLPLTVQQSGLPRQGTIVWGLTTLSLTVLLINKANFRQLLIVNILGFLAFFIFFLHPGLFLIDNARQRPLRELAILAAQIKKPQEELFMVGFKKPSVSFYSNSIVNYQPSNELQKYLQSNTKKLPPSVLVIGRTKEIDNVGLKPQQYQTIDSKGVYELIRIETSKLSS